MRWLVPKDVLLADPRTERVSIETPGTFVEWTAPDRRLVAYPCSDDKIMNLCAFAPSVEFQDPDASNEEGKTFQLVHWHVWRLTPRRV